MKRNLSLDYLRNFANLSRCLLHAAIPYMFTNAPVWPVNEAGAWFFDLLIFEIHLYVMELFFLIAGFVFAIQFYKKTTSELLKDRLKRIIIPFILGLIILIPLVLSFFYLVEYSGNINLNNIKISYLKGWNLALGLMYPTAHLWFLYYLLFFYVFTFFLKNILKKMRSININYLLFSCIIISCICMSYMQRWIVDNPLTLVPEIPSLVHYYMFFAIGFIINSSKLQLISINLKSKIWLIVGIVLGIFAVIPQFYFQFTDIEYYNFIKISAILLYCFSSYLIVFGLWGCFNTIKFKASKQLAYLTDSSYWVYIINMPFVASIQILLIPISISIFLKFIISFLGALILSLLSYELFVRYTFLGTLINRKRVRKKQ